MPDSLEFTLRIKLGGTGAVDYAALNSALRSVTDQLERLYADSIRNLRPIPEFRQETRSVCGYDLFGPAVTAEMKLAEDSKTGKPRPADWLRVNIHTDRHTAGIRSQPIRGLVFVMAFYLILAGIAFGIWELFTHVF